jgi:hypothetical protein
VPGEQTLRVGEVLEIQQGRIVFSRVYHGWRPVKTKNFYNLKRSN